MIYINLCHHQTHVYYLNICNQLTHILHKMQFLCSQSDILKILCLINLLFSFEFLVELPMSKYNFILRTLFKDVVCRLVNESVDLVLNRGEER